jgi:hypothetical protein
MGSSTICLQISINDSIVMEYSIFYQDDILIAIISETCIHYVEGTKILYLEYSPMKTIYLKGEKRYLKKVFCSDDKNIYLPDFLCLVERIIKDLECPEQMILNSDKLKYSNDVLEYFRHLKKQHQIGKNSFF